MFRASIVFCFIVLFSSDALGRSVLQSTAGSGDLGTETSTTSTGGGCTVVINEVVHKPEDVGDVEGVDFVELHNPCRAKQDLTGWSLTDEDENMFVMGENGCTHSIDSGEFLVLFRDNPCSFEFGYTGVDIATLKDAKGKTISVVEWGVDDANIGRSWSAIPDGSKTFKDGSPTPGVANEEYVE